MSLNWNTSPSLQVPLPKKVPTSTVVHPSIVMDTEEEEEEEEGSEGERRMDDERTTSEHADTESRLDIQENKHSPRQDNKESMMAAADLEEVTCEDNASSAVQVKEPLSSQDPATTSSSTQSSVPGRSALTHSIMDKIKNTVYGPTA